MLGRKRPTGLEIMNRKTRLDSNLEIAAIRAKRNLKAANKLDRAAVCGDGLTGRHMVSYGGRFRRAPMLVDRVVRVLMAWTPAPGSHRRGHRASAALVLNRRRAQ